MMMMKRWNNDDDEKVEDRVEGKPGVLELFHPDLPLATGTTITDLIIVNFIIIMVIIIVSIIFFFSVTVGQTPATARQSMTVTTTIGWSSDDKKTAMVKR